MEEIIQEIIEANKDSLIDNFYEMNGQSLKGIMYVIEPETGSGGTYDRRKQLTVIYTT